MKLIITVFCLFLFSCLAQAKEQDTIRVVRSSWSNSYYIGSEKFQKHEIVDTLNSKPDFSPRISSYYTARTMGMISLISGTFILGYSITKLAQTMNNFGEPPVATSYYFITGAGIVLNVFGILFISGANRTLNRAIVDYNNKINKNGRVYNDELKLNFGLNRIYLTYSF